MPLPNTMADLAVLAASCNPPGGEILGTQGDDYHRNLQAIVRRESARGADLAVLSGVLTPGNDGNYFSVSTSPATVTGIANTWIGREVTFVFQGAATIVHSSSLLLPGGLDVSAVAGRVYTFIQEAAAPVWRLTGSDSHVLGVPVTIQIFTATGTYTRPAGCRRGLVQVQGPGASGRGANGFLPGQNIGLSAGSGGGAGGYSESLLDLTSIPTASVVVPAGGVGVSGFAGNPGAGDSTFVVNGVVLVSARPGQLGSGHQAGATDKTVVVTQGGLGATPGIGNMTARGGEDGDHGVVFNAGTQCVAGKGGASMFGIGGSAIIRTAVGLQSGMAAKGFGSGGGGAVSRDSGTVAGGNGAGGRIVVLEFY